MPDISVDLDFNTVTVEGKTVKVRPTGAEIMTALIKAGGKVVTTERLLSAIYGIEGGSDDLLHVHIINLRRALALTAAKVINVHGRGYILRLGDCTAVSFLTAADCKAEGQKAKHTADKFDAMAHSAGKGMADRYQALARALRDVAGEWDRVGKAVA